MKAEKRKRNNESQRSKSENLASISYQCGGSERKSAKSRRKADINESNGVGESEEGEMKIMAA